MWPTTGFQVEMQIIQGKYLLHLYNNFFSAVLNKKDLYFQNTIIKNTLLLILLVYNGLFRNIFDS